MRVCIATILLGVCLAARASAADPLPEGDQGIAANYPNDEGIGGDAAVLLADDFESYADASGLSSTWDVLFQQQQIRIATEPESVFAGGQALEFSIPQQDQELSNTADKLVSPERDVLFLRYYSKFMPPFDVVGSSHNGSVIAAHYFVDGNATPGIPADGMNKFLAAYENWRGEPATPSPGNLNVYVYHPEQRDNYGDHFFPTGLVMPNTSLPFDFGPDFVPRDDIIQELDRWYCYEFMVQANTPGELDGRIAFWLDGVLAADFQNLRLRDIDSLKIDRFGIGFHTGSNPNGEQKKWYDNVVAADLYIGPLFEPGAGDGTSDSGADTTAGSGATNGSASASDEGSAGDTSGGPGSGADDGPGSGGGTDTMAPADDDGASGCGCRTTDSGGRYGFFALALASIALRQRARTRVRGACVVGLTVLIACGGGEDEGDTSPTVADDGTIDPASSSGGPTSGATTDESTGPTSADSTEDTVDPTNATGSTGMTDPGVCMPAMASFIIEPPALAQASITFDFDAMTCAAIGLTGDAPQLVLDVQQTGTVNATGFGLEITDSSHGLLFENPPIGDSQVQDLMPDIEFTMLATSVDGAQPVTIVFTIFSQGPTLIDVSVVFG